MQQYEPRNRQQPPLGPPPQWPPQPPPGPPAQEPGVQKPPGCLIPGIWLGLAALVTLVCAVFVGLSAYDSESAGVRATQIVSIPFGAFWSGAIAAVVIHLAFKKASSAVRIAAPIGCGCLGGIFFLVLIVVFFGAIFPAL